MRAVDHAIEGLYRPLVPPPLKYLYYGALADLFKYLPETKKNPQAIDVRQRLQIASWMSLWPVRFETYRWEASVRSLYVSIAHTYPQCCRFVPRSWTQVGSSV